MAERTIVGGIDAWVGEVEPNASHNGSAYVYVQKDASGDAYALIFVKAPAPVASGSAVLDGSLVLHSKYASAAGLTFKVTPLAASWKAGKVTWNNQPDVRTAAWATAATATLSSADRDTLLTFDVGAQLQGVADGSDWYGWRLECTTAGGIATFFSTEAGAEWRRPRLITEWSNAPVAPTDLSPSGGRFVSIEAPVLRYTFADYGGNDDLAFQQIQVESLDEFGEPTHTVILDTGKVATVDPEYDLAADATWTALTNGDAVRWRVKVWDGVGLASDWSDWAPFERLVKGTLTIDSPGDAPNDFVTDVTPTITWTHAGSWSQTHWQVIVEQMGEAAWFQVANSRKRSGNDSGWQVPKGALTKANWTNVPIGGGLWDTVPTQYRVTVRTWDGQGRERTPGDPAWYQDRQEFVVREGATAKVTNLQVATDYPYPWVRITWERATAPDKFIIARGGNIVDEVLPQDVATGVGTYEYIDRRARPNIEHAWAILPVENGVLSAVESTYVTTTLRSEGIWLTNPERASKSAVLILGIDSDGGSFDATMEDQGENFDVIGSARTMRITNALKGFSGTVSGYVTTHPALPSIDAREWADRLLDFKAEPGARLILTLSDVAIPVVAYDIVAKPSPIPDALEVEFKFFQDNVPRFAV